MSEAKLSSAKVLDPLVSVSGSEYRRVCAENAALKAKAFYKADSALILAAASLMETEAETWAEGMAVRGKGNEWLWEPENEWAHVRYHRLVRTAQRLRDMAARIVRVQNTELSSGGAR